MRQTADTYLWFLLIANALQLLLTVCYIFYFAEKTRKDEARNAAIAILDQRVTCDYVTSQKIGWNHEP